MASEYNVSHVTVGLRRGLIHSHHYNKQTKRHYLHFHDGSEHHCITLDMVQEDAVKILEYLQVATQVVQDAKPELEIPVPTGPALA